MIFASPMTQIASLIIFVLGLGTDWDLGVLPCLPEAFFPVRDDVPQLLGNYHKEDGL